MSYIQLPQIGYTNGISLKQIKSWKKGQTFVIQKTKDKKWIEDPKEIVIEHIEELPDDCNFTVSYKIIGTCKTIINITSLLMSPVCSDYNIYKNWAYYFSVNVIKVKNKKIKVEELEYFIDKFQQFEKQFRDSNPEKLI